MVHSCSSLSSKGNRCKNISFFYIKWVSCGELAAFTSPCWDYRLYYPFLRYKLWLAGSVHRQLFHQPCSSHSVDNISSLFCIFLTQILSMSTNCPLSPTLRQNVRGITQSLQKSSSWDHKYLHKTSKHSIHKLQIYYIISYYLDAVFNNWL